MRKFFQRNRGPRNFSFVQVIGVVQIFKTQSLYFSYITFLNVRGSENSVIPPCFRVGKQPFNSIVLVICGKQLCRGVENKKAKVRNTKTLSFSLLNTPPALKCSKELERALLSSTVDTKTVRYVRVRQKLSRWTYLSLAQYIAWW